VATKQPTLPDSQACRAPNCAANLVPGWCVTTYRTGVKCHDRATESEWALANQPDPSAGGRRTLRCADPKRTVTNDRALAPAPAFFTGISPDGRSVL
jgi:hypothetical protein